MDPPVCRRIAFQHCSSRAAPATWEDVTQIRRQQLRAGLLAIGLVWATGAPAVACTGDCDGNGTVTVAELITGVGISLGGIALSECEAFDANRDGQLRIDELVAA